LSHQKYSPWKENITLLLLSTQRLYELRVFLTVNIANFRTLALAVETLYVPCEVRTEFCICRVDEFKSLEGKSVLFVMLPPYKS
jgi:hypothetical protein